MACVGRGDRRITVRVVLLVVTTDSTRVDSMIVVELFGVCRLRAGAGRLTLDAASIREALNGLGRACPSLVGTVLIDDSVHPAYRLNLNGDRFVTDPATPLADGDCLLLLSADVGG